MDFSGVKDSEIDAILEFLETTLGQQVSFRDWNGRVWSGVINSPDAAITKQGINLNDIALELDVDENFLELDACNTFNVTQSSVMEFVPV